MPAAAPTAAGAALVLLSNAGFDGRTPFLGEDWFPSDPDDVVAVHEYPGRGAFYTLAGLPSLLHVRLQIRTRSADRDYDTARYYAWRCWRVLGDVTNVKVTAAQMQALFPNTLAEEVCDVTIQSIMMNDSPSLTTRDERDRTVFVLNGDIWLEVP